MTPAATIAVCAACALIGIPLGRWKGRRLAGVLAGLLLGPLGLLALLALPATAEARIRREQRRIRDRREAERREAAR